MTFLSKLGKYHSLGLLLMRLGLGFMMILHGYPKLLGGPDKWHSLGNSMIYLGVGVVPVFWGFMAAITETLGGALVMLGLAFRPACIFLLFTMVVAAVTHLSKGDTILDASHAIELASVFLGLIFVGPGRYSVDKS